MSPTIDAPGINDRGQVVDFRERAAPAMNPADQGVGHDVSVTRHSLERRAQMVPGPTPFTTATRVNSM
jgi:hypothetical protein